MLPSGTKTIAVRPARAAIAAIDADVLPVEAHTQALASSASAADIATAMPRSLNDPVGLAPSTLSQPRAPVCSDSHADSRSGVPPSARLTTGASGARGNHSRYSST